jgi:LmbE family N-acetylglucosaminyl deacetylase
VTKSHTLPLVPTIAVLVAGALAASIAVGLAMRPKPVTEAGPLASSQLGRRVLVIAPHPDDEVLTAGGTIHHLLATGAQVRVVIVTAGDSYFRAARLLGTGPMTPRSFRHLGDVRHAESLAAATDLGLPPADVVSLGFPDGSAPVLWDSDWSREATSIGRTGSTAVPYAWAAQPQAPYTGLQVVSEIEAQVRDFRPDTVIGPDTRETHPDHAGVAEFVTYALDDIGYTGMRLTAFVHFKLYPFPAAYMPWSTLSPPPVLAGDGSTWLSLPLEVDDIVAKRTALEAYRSQFEVGAAALYMRALVRSNELFDERPAAVPATQTADSVPGSGALGTVVVTPSPAIALSTPQPGRIASVRMLIGPHRVWVGIVSEEPLRAAYRYRVFMRLVGGAGSPARLDVTVRSGAAEVLRAEGDSVLPTGVTTQTQGRTLWISLPASVLASHAHALISANAGPLTGSPFRTALRDVAL